MSRVVDTNVVSFLLKGDSRADLYLPMLTGHILTVSFMTVAELDRWALEAKWGKARIARMDKLLRRYVIHPYSRDLCRRWAKVSTDADRKGQPIGFADAWIAATALEMQLELVTHNPGDFAVVEELRIVTALR